MRVGIDLGTTYSVVARYKGETSETEVIPNKYGRNLTPSVICFLDNGKTVIGDDAKEMQKKGEGIIASAFKVRMGSNLPCAEANGKIYTAEDLSSLMIGELVREAERSTGEKVESVVLTVPAYFDDLQRSSTRTAAEKAGVKVSRIVNEPTAAAIYYGYKHADGKTVLVYDLGGGTFDVTIVHIKRGSIEVKATKGNHDLGGKDWDETLMNLLCDRFTDEFGVDPRDDVSARYEILADCEDYKKVLSRSESVVAEIRYGGNVGRYVVDREGFESATEYLANATNEVLDSIFLESGVKISDIDEILLCGGSSRLPAVRRLLREYGFGNIISHTDTDLAVAKGAAVVASLYSNDINRIRDVTIRDVSSHSLGVLSIDPTTGMYRNEIMIPCNTPVPASVTKQFRIEKENLTDQIEVYMLQGESEVPADCTVIKREVVTGFENSGNGLVVDITYSYDDEGSVNVTASRNGKDLTVIHETLPEDTEWLSKPPKTRTGNKRVSKSIAICIDLSRSMKDSLPEVKTAVNNFVTSLDGEFTKFVLIGFGDRAKALTDLTTDDEDIHKAVEALKINRLGRGTDGDPLPLVRDILSGQKGARTALILTDGLWGKRDEAVEYAAECRKEMINIVAVGFGDADRSFLRQIATIEEGAMYTTISNLGRTINTIATAIIDSPTGLVEHFG